MENKNTVTGILLAAICSVIFLGTIQSGVVFAKKYTADLSGDNEVPPVSSSASGKAIFRTGANDTTIKYKLNITGLSDATMAHIHVGKAGQNGEVVVDLMKDSKVNPTKMGLAIRGNVTNSELVGPLQGKTVADLVNEMNTGNAYANIHDAQHPKGVIRGQIEASGSALGNSSGNASPSMNMNASSNSPQ
ncbi:MAG TPA: CHRD domain-containing protein [Nitrososphaeraceae archaeon]